ncbi:MAG TPA: neutral zinc metallopeptidase [Actinomycetota bacterium]|nr:neutral zinc metallopeptidase [Actinomycetota bacterium]
MRWRRRRRSGHLRDERASGGGFGFGGGGFPIPVRMGLPGLLILVVLFFLQRGLGGGGGVPGIERFPSAPDAPPGSEGVSGAPDPEAELVDFVSFVLDDTQQTWTDLFRRSGRTYRPAELVLFRESTQTGCGLGSSQVGPFYCPADQTVYLDLGFFEELQQRFGAPGDFAQAYVIAHEIGHHVQNQLGIMDEVRSQSEEDPDSANELSIKQELQADCLAGIWGHSTYERRLLERGDLEEGLDAASAVGDDRIQRETTGRVDRESWTHGSARQRRAWFRTGFDSGDPDSCDTFA